MEESNLPIECDTLPIECDEVTDLKERLMKLNIAECQHVLNYLQYNRDDLLICYSLPYPYFQMDIPNFKAFKTWLLSSGALNLEDLLCEVFQNSQEAITEIKKIPELLPSLLSKSQETSEAHSSSNVVSEASGLSQ